MSIQAGERRPLVAGLSPPPPTADARLSRVRDQYLQRLGYLPLRFRSKIQANQERARLHAQLDNNAPGLTRRSTTLLEIPPPGSIRGSVFNLCAATLGAGALSLPYAFSESGLWTGLALLVVAAALTIYTIQLLVDASRLTGLKSYEDLAMYCFGSGAALFVEVNILLFCFGICVAYLVTMGDIVGPLGAAYASRAELMTAFTVVLMFPLSLLRDISSLQCASMLGVCSILFLVLAVAFRSAQQVAADGVADSVVWTLNTQGGGVFLCVPVILFAFTCQINVFSIFLELQRPSIRRMSKVVNRATLISLLVYLLIGAAAYLAFGAAVTGNALLIFPASDALIACSKAAISLTVALAFPLNVFPCRFTLEMMFFADAKLSTPRHVAITAALVFGALFIAIYVPSIQVIFGIIGGTCSSIVCFAFPAAFRLQLAPGPFYRRENWAPLALLVGSIVVGAMSTAITIYQNFISA